MRQILDAGAFVALERNDRAIWRRLKAALLAGEPPLTHGGVIAQVWRGGTGRQAVLAKAVRAVDTVPLDLALARGAGVLLARSDTRDAIDAAVAVLAEDGDRIVTSDPDDLQALVVASGRRVDVVSV